MTQQEKEQRLFDAAAKYVIENNVFESDDDDMVASFFEDFAKTKEVIEYHQHETPDLEAIKKGFGKLFSSEFRELPSPHFINTVFNFFAPHIGNKGTEWISVNDRLPNIGQEVICFIQYKYNEMPTHDIIVGHIQEDGDLIITASDDSYGWTFEECVTHWAPLPKAPGKEVGNG